MAFFCHHCSFTFHATMNDPQPTCPKCQDRYFVNAWIPNPIYAPPIPTSTPTPTPVAVSTLNPNARVFVPSKKTAGPGTTPAPSSTSQDATGPSSLPQPPQTSSLLFTNVPSSTGTVSTTVSTTTLITTTPPVAKGVWGRQTSAKIFEMTPEQEKASKEQAEIDKKKAQILEEANKNNEEVKKALNWLSDTAKSLAGQLPSGGPTYPTALTYKQWEDLSKAWVAKSGSDPNYIYSVRASREEERRSRVCRLLRGEFRAIPQGFKLLGQEFSRHGPACDRVDQYLAEGDLKRSNARPRRFAKAVEPIRPPLGTMAAPRFLSRRPRAIHWVGAHPVRPLAMARALFRARTPSSRVSRAI